MTETGKRDWWRLSRVQIVALLGVAVLLTALFSPGQSDDNGAGPTTHSTAPSGAGMVYELAERMGWRAARRNTAFELPVDASSAATTQVVLAPQGDLSEREVHALLENVRSGGGLIFDIPGNDLLADSLGISLGLLRMPTLSADLECRPSGGRGQELFMTPPSARAVRWRRPPPGRVTQIGETAFLRNASVTLGVGFPLGVRGGRVVAMTSTALFTNDMLSRCEWGADVGVVRALEYARPGHGDRPALVFDEFHHGFGIHRGSFTAIALYLSRTASGQALAQALAAALVLLFAAMARPVVPREPERIARRSPLEHVDALSRAYLDVRATRTATARLVSGLRRRTGRTVPVNPGVDDDTFLDGVAARHPSLAESTTRVKRALRESVRPRELVAVGAALERIEQRLTLSLSSSRS